MKNILTKSVGALLILLTLLSTLTGCYLNEEYRRGDNVLTGEFIPDFYAKVESDTAVVNKNNVTFDFSYALYSRLNNESLEECRKIFCFESTGQKEGEIIYKESNFAIYISENKKLELEEDETGKLVDYKNKVNATLWKFINSEEAFSTDHGFTVSRKPNSFFTQINYAKKERMTIPTEFFSSPNGYVYIHIVRLIHDVGNDKYFLDKYGMYTLEIKYQLIGNTVILR